MGPCGENDADVCSGLATFYQRIMLYGACCVLMKHYRVYFCLADMHVYIYSWCMFTDLLLMFWFNL